jgi:hypothetical protein
VADSIGPPRPATIPPEAAPQPGCFYGTGIAGCVDYFVKRFGPAAAHTAIAKLPRHYRLLVQPHAPTLGILGAKKYPYPFVGELFRSMAAAVHMEEDVFVRQVISAGMDHSLATVNRIALRWASSPASLAGRAQELWNMFHDTGRITIVWKSDNEYVTELADWPNHDVTVCKACVEARRRMLEHTNAKDLEMRREKCVAWGHELCATRVRWRA